MKDTIIYKNRKKIKIFTKIRHKRRINFLSKFILIWRGKRDGKKGIPYKVNANWVSPTIQEEHNRINALVSNVYGVLNKFNTDNYVILERYIADFEDHALEIKNIHTFLSDKLTPFHKALCITPNSHLTPAQEEILKAKRKSEKDSEDIGIRIRRFNEYQQSIAPLRKKYITLKNEFEQLFKIVSESLGELRSIDEQVKYLYYETCAISNTRLSWYWHGVLKKHKDKDTMKIDVPQNTDIVFKSLYDANIAALDTRLNELSIIRDEILSLSIV